MRMQRLLTSSRAAATLAVVCGLLCLPSTAAASAPTNTSPPTIQNNNGESGPPAVGQQLWCNAGTWNSTDGGQTYESSVAWYRDTATGTPVATTYDYAPTTDDLGHRLICTITEESSVDNASSAPVASAPSAEVLPYPSVNLTEYQPSVSGNIGESDAGVGVSVALERGGQSVASASTKTAPDGSWSTTLLNPNSAAEGVTSLDTVVVSYQAPSGSSGMTIPDVSTYAAPAFSGEGATISADGDSVSLPYAYPSCAAQYAVIVNGQSQPAATAPVSGCTFTPSKPLTDADAVQVASTVSEHDPTNGALSSLTTTSDAGLLGVAGGAPICSADLVSGQVTCARLDGSSFAITDNGGSPVALSPVSQGQASAFLPHAAAGDVIRLTETGANAPTRVLSTLHVGSLRIDVPTSYNAATSGSCDAGEWVGYLYLNNGPYGPAFQSSMPCSPAGAFSTSQGYGDTMAELDNHGGGGSIVNVPSLIDQIPASDDSVPGSFTAYADLNGVGSTSQVLSQVSSVTLAITPRGGGQTVNVAMTPQADSTGAFITGTVSGLAPGEYVGNWTLTDSHGDTAASSTVFAVQAAEAGQPGASGATGPQGATGATGAQGPTGQTGAAGATGATGATGPAGPKGDTGATGPQGPAGAAAIAGHSGSSAGADVFTCVQKTTGSGSRRRTTQTCTASLLVPQTGLVSVEISRAGTTYAIATRSMRKGRAHLRLRELRPMRPGNYVITIMTRTGFVREVKRLP